jgi:SAM-dependent methyltransferase
MAAIAGVAPGRALDLACGAGRHALYLAQAGWSVKAVDSSPAGIGILREHAAALGLVVDTRIADLETGEFVLEENAYDLIVDCNYLQRDLFSRMRAAVRPSGRVVAMIQMVDDSPGLAPMNPAYLFRPGELRGFFRGWEILHDTEMRPKPNSRMVAELIAQRAGTIGPGAR